MPTLPHIPGKVAVSGAAGRNGFATLIKLMMTPYVTELVGMIRKEESIEEVEARIRAFEESKPKHGHVTPRITQNPEDAKDAQIWVNWKGISLEVLKKTNPNLEQDAKKRGMHLRDMLLEANISIAAEDAKLALKYAPNCIYIQEGNPTEILSRFVMKMGFRPGKVISTGTLMEYYRFIKLFSQKFPGISMDRSTGLYIGEHGEKAVPVKNRMSLGGARTDEYVKSIYGEKGISLLQEIYKDVNKEAFWLREKTKMTPFEGPSSVSADVIKMMLKPQKNTVVGITAYVNDSKHYGLKDISISLPVVLGKEGVVKILDIELDDEAKKALKEAAGHIQAMNIMADRIAKKNKYY